jgi:hypothetical protein
MLAMTGRVKRIPITPNKVPAISMYTISSNELKSSV